MEPVHEVPEGTVPSNGRGGAAFVEMDHTLMAGSATLALARGLAVAGALSTRDLAAMAWHHATAIAFGEDLGGDLGSDLGGDLPTGPGAPAGASRQHVWDSALEHLAGRRVDELALLTEATFDEFLAERVWPGTQALLARHLAAGEQVWLLSVAPVEIASVFARRLGLTGALATVAETRHGRYTGRIVGRPFVGRARAARVLELVGEENLDLARCTAYVHSIADLPLLALVGTPVAVNPDPALDRLARRRRWQRHDWRRHERRLGAAAMRTGAAVTLAAAAGAAGAAWGRRHA